MLCLAANAIDGMNAQGATSSSLRSAVATTVRGCGCAIAWAARRGVVAHNLRQIHFNLSIGTRRVPGYLGSLSFEFIHKYLILPPARYWPTSMYTHCTVY
eukprot:SAG11_NODE_2946_length_2820_cov_2.023153_6_plen_100_part_00